MTSFGINLSYGRLVPDPNSLSLYREMLDLAVLSDRLGFGTIWLLEHHFMFTMQSPSPLLVAAQLSGHVKCRVGTAVCALPYRHPLLQAGEIAAADNILEGRLEVGVGRGAFKSEFDRFGLDFSKGNDAFIENLDVVTRLLASESGIAYEGQFYKFPRSMIWPRPVQKPHPPVWVGAQTKQTLEWAVRKGYNVMHSPFFTPVEPICELARTFHQIREEVGIRRGQIRFAVLQPTYVSESKSDCLRIADHMVRRQRLQNQLKHYDFVPELHNYVPPEPSANEITPEQVIQNTLVGTPEQLIEKIQIEEEAGVDHIMLQAAWTIPFEDAAKSMRLFERRVMGRF